MKFCPECGASVKEDSRFCMNCGFSLQKYKKDGDPGKEGTPGTESPESAPPEFGEPETASPEPSGTENGAQEKNVSDDDRQNEEYSGAGAAAGTAAEAGPELDESNWKDVLDEENRNEQEDRFQEAYQNAQHEYDDQRRQYRAPAAAAPVGPPPESRSIVVAIILSIVTCGIYHLYWIYSVAKGWKYYFDQQGVRDVTEPGIVILLAIVTCGIYLIYYWFKLGKQVAQVRNRRGELQEDLSLAGLLFAIFGLGIVSLSLMQHKLNHMED
ncbi:MAG: DUF4234 domain-containing protein [Eubacterium sp.]|nr:DUF4234 domain-containing protein [Eubacterium sp.]